MSQPIDVAYVDIVARDKSLDKLRKDIDKTFDAVDKDVLNHLEQVDKSFDKTFDDIDKHFSGLERRTAKTFDAIGETIHDTFDDVDRDGNRVSQLFRRVFTEIGDHVGQLAGGIGKLGGLLGSFASGSPFVAFILALVPAIIALAAALSNLIGLVALLPAGIGFLVASIAPAVVAFQNFGEAVSALAEGDIEKIDAALAKLSPSARQAARELANLLPVLRDFQRGVQEAFFSQFRGSFAQLIGILPQIAENFNRIAAALGGFARRFVDLLGSLNVLNAMNDLFDTTAHLIEDLSGPALRLFEALAVSVSAALPFIDRIAAAFGRALDAFAAFINKSIETGAFNEFVEDAFTTVKELVALVKALGGLLGTLFAGTEEAGHGLIVTLTDLTIRLDNFLKSAEGQEVLRDLSLLVKGFGAALGAVLTSLILLDRSFRTSLEMLSRIGRGFAIAGEAIGNFFGQVPAKIEEFRAFLGRIPQAIVDMIKATFDLALQIIGTQIGLVLFAIQVLPEKIVEFIRSIPGRIGEALSSTGPTILEIFGRAFNDAKLFLELKFAEIVAFIRTVPSKLAALGPVFLQAGKNLITSFMNGFRSVGSFIGDVAGDIVRSVKSFLNRAIDKINSGIAAIDAVLPGELARIPRLASGALVRHRPGGTLAVVGEGREDEAVAPLSKLEDMIKKVFNGRGGGTTISFGAGAISVSFAGVVPTEAEARTVGRAVGDGIADQLARRDVRTQVRAA